MERVSTAGWAIEWRVVRKTELQKLSKRQTTSSSWYQNSFCRFRASIFTPTTTTPHPKLSIGFTRQTFCCRKMPKLDSELLVLMSIVEIVHLGGFSTSLAQKFLSRQRFSISSEVWRKKKRNLSSLVSSSNSTRLRNLKLKFNWAQYIELELDSMKNSNINLDLLFHFIIRVYL